MINYVETTSLNMSLGNEYIFSILRISGFFPISYKKGCELGRDAGNELTRHSPNFNPLSPHDALKHDFTSLKTDLIFLQLRVLEWIFLWIYFTNTWQFSLIFKQHQVIFTMVNSGLKGLIYYSFNIMRLRWAHNIICIVAVAFSNIHSMICRLFIQKAYIYDTVYITDRHII